MNTLNDAPTREQLIAFLDGSGPLGGFYFGEKPANERGYFWWRKYLPILANTPESSAAQGAVTREALLHLICDYTGNRINLPNFTIEELEDFARGVLSVGWKPADDSILLCVACSEPTGAQPSDATAQPSDLSQLRRFACFENEDGVYEDAFGSYVMFRDVEKLLANTAQGKTEQCPTCRGNDADAPCAYPSCGMTGCLRDKRLAAKKG